MPYGCSCSIDHSVHAAISTENLEALELLLGDDASKDMLNVSCGGETPLHKAVRMAYEDDDVGCTMSKLLLAHGSSIDAKNAAGLAPIHYACRTQRLPVVQLLLQHGAGANVVTSRGFTPLHILCRRPPPFDAENLSVLKVLLAHGAAPAQRDAHGLRPYDYINKPDLGQHPRLCGDPFKVLMRDLLVKAEQQWIRDERWHARRSCLLLRARPESGHIVCQLTEELFRAVVRFL
jgi:ankyrin repeat protein